MPNVVSPPGTAACVHPDRVARVQADSPSPQETAQVAKVFKLLGDPTRARLLYALLAADELCVCDLASVTATSEATVSQALRLLRASGVVIGRREGRNVFYSLSDAHVRVLLEVAREHSRHTPSEVH
ncbi:MAG: ArsR/SmtB family transcription factor [Actinomycetales bacterium]